jgi:integrase
MSRRTKPATATRRRSGRVSVYEHHGGWYLYYNDAGKPVRRRIDGGEARAEYDASLLNARLVATEANLRVDVPAEATRGAGGRDGDGDAPVSVAVPDLRRAFLDHHELVLGSAVTTVSRYRAATRYLEEFALARGWDVGGVDVGRFVEHLRQVEVAPNGHANTARRRLRDKGVVYILECCRSMYHFGHRHGVLPPSPANAFTRFGLGRLWVRDAKPIFVFDATQEVAFLSAATPWAFAVHLVLARTGLRPGELCHLLIEDVDCDAGWLHVRGKPELGWSVKTGRERRVPLLTEVASVLRAVTVGRLAGPVFLRERFDQTGLAAVVTGDRAALAAIADERLGALRTQLGRVPSRRENAACRRTVWRDAGAVDVDRVRVTFLAAARRAGLPATATCPRSWRHTFATLLQEANVDPLIRQETLGHKPASADASPLGMTGVYTHTSPTLQRREVERALRLRPDTLKLVDALVVPAPVAREEEVQHAAL